MATQSGCQAYPPSPFSVCGAIRDKYNQMGGPTSFLLFPKSAEKANPGNTGKRSDFFGGSIYWSAASGAHPVAHDFLTKYGDHSYEQGFLRYPTTDEIVLDDGVSRRQEFQGGRIYWNPVTWAHSIGGEILDKWLALGGETGTLGFPTSDETRTPDGVGRFNTFQNGSIYWSPDTGAHAVFGPIEWFWALAGREAGVYGYPIDEPTYDGDDVSQDFEKGQIVLWDGQLGGVHQVDYADDEIGDDDTWVFPEYPEYPRPRREDEDFADLWAKWNTIEDPSGDQKEDNRNAAAAVDGGMISVGGLDNARYLWKRLYQHPGIDVTLDASTVNDWMNETSPHDSQFPTPVEVRAKNRDNTVAVAIRMADMQNRPFNAILMSVNRKNKLSWETVTGAKDDYYFSLGHHSMSVIVKPGTVGNHPVRLAQQAHIYDIYDYSENNNGDGYGDVAAAVAVEGFKLGIIKWFQVFGHGSQIKWEGLR